MDKQARNFILIGLTGNIGSGKSTAAQILQQLGAAVVDADKTGHNILMPGKPAYAQVLQQFGAEFAAEDGSIRRKALGEHVFSDPSGERLMQLNAITHPAIYDENLRRMQELADEGYRVVVLEAFGLLGSQRMIDLCDEIWLVTAPRETLINRVMQRDRFDEQTVANRLDSQMKAEDMAALSTRVFINDGSIDDLRTEITAAFAEVAAL